MTTTVSLPGGPGQTITVTGPTTTEKCTNVGPGQTVTVTGPTVTTGPTTTVTTTGQCTNVGPGGTSTCATITKWSTVGGGYGDYSTDSASTTGWSKGGWRGKW
ncbi:hypothetical protein AYL99_10562 [Fonsecaea erecta]|uniref:Uncharacterized protein n=1 Tax=Fonsecaea erecta TaxID=1367422 RepID=A0A178Z742_9EURO|nr:hypothetical protein AYL99_10562 [Fonsecaea erecta]OAP55589.1 hypothetical protein AYL99_10562 [Fonsecaea erecta]